MVKFDVTSAPMREDIVRLENSLTVTNFEKGFPPHQPKPVSVFLRDKNGGLLAGLNGQTVWEWLYIDTLWVSSACRNQGIGTKLVEAAEGEATRRGCHAAYVWTQNFEAPGFYQNSAIERSPNSRIVPRGTRR